MKKNKAIKISPEDIQAETREHYIVKSNCRWAIKHKFGKRVIHGIETKKAAINKAKLFEK